MKLKKGDTVMVTIGKDKGKKGKIEKIFPKIGMATISGVNVYKRHTKKRDEKMPGGIIEHTRPLTIAKLALICPKCGKLTRVGFIVAKGEKERMCRKCKQKI
ncbi:50S ribosomal protein L24 [Candidatus Gottesmanbacteria bacterium]|nr:50S ribosomal protein L24 [Candidatus Gottesmanbacteria bacterium]